MDLRSIQINYGSHVGDHNENDPFRYFRVPQQQILYDEMNEWFDTMICQNRIARNKICKVELQKSEASTTGYYTREYIDTNNIEDMKKVCV